MQYVAGGHEDLAGRNPSETLSQIKGGLVRAQYVDRFAKDECRGCAMRKAPIAVVVHDRV